LAKAADKERWLADGGKQTAEASPITQTFWSKRCEADAMKQTPQQPAERTEAAWGEAV
jgi:hypothetical protein